MKILTFVDLHGSNDALKRISASVKKEDVDYVVCAGDITIFGDCTKRILKRIDAFGKPVLLIHGNHEDEHELRRLCRGAKNINFLHKEVFDAGGHVFVCYGGGGFSLRDKEFERWSKRMFKKIGKDKKIILVTHAPPFETKLDMILDQPAGNVSIRKFIESAQPVLAICGHLHENAGLTDKIKASKLINPGPWGKILKC